MGTPVAIELTERVAQSHDAFFDNGKPAVRLGRKAMGPAWRRIARLPKRRRVRTGVF